MNEKKLQRMFAGIEPWKENFGMGMERRGADGVSWYDLSVNVNSFPCEPDTAIIVTAWSGQLKWLKATLTNYKLSGAFVILAYDNPFYGWIPKGSSQSQIALMMPQLVHYLLADCVVMKHKTADSNKRNGWFWDVRYAQGIVKQFKNIKYVYVTNGDCIWEKPEGLPKLIEFLGDADLTAGQNTENVIHTADMLFKVEAFHKIFDYMAELMRVPIIGSRSPERMLKEAVNSLKLKYKSPPKQPLDKDGNVDMYACYGQDSTFKDIVGFRNLFAEYETAGNECRELFGFEKFVDNYMNWLYWGGEEKNTICKFWETKDRRYLYMWLDRWEDSSYNRSYTPLDFYCDRPIYDRNEDTIFYRQV